MSFEREICWKPDRLTETLNPVAEFLPPEVFLAVHTPHQLTYRAARGVTWPEPERFLEQFLTEGTYSAVMVVGEQGSGKSHFVTWMYHAIMAREDNQGREIIRVPRSGLSLYEVLRLIVNKLEGADYEKYQQKLNASQGELKDHATRKSVLLKLLGAAFDQASPLAREGTTEHAMQVELLPYLQHLFTDTHLRGTWLALRDSVLDRLINHIVNRSDARQELPGFRRFVPDDIHQATQVDWANVAEPTRELLTRLSFDPSMTDIAVGLINEYTRVAVESLLNFGGNDLQQLLLDVRAQLARAGKSLVLLFEDIGRTQGIDRQLLEGLTADIGRAPTADRCELRWTAACMDTYFQEQVPQNIQARLSQVIDMDRATADRQSVSDAYILELTARRLAASRLTSKQLNDWYLQDRKRDAHAPVPNRCTPCDFRPVCHATFGHVQIGTDDPIGLYPLSTSATTTMLTLVDPDYQVRFNPRALVSNVVKNVLDHASEELKANEFPSERLRSTMLDEQTVRWTMGQVEQDLRTQNASQAGRQLTLLELWGSTETKVDLPKDIWTAFGVPEPGEIAVVELEGLVQRIASWGSGAPLGARDAQHLRDLLHHALVQTVDWDQAGFDMPYFAGSSGAFRPGTIVFRGGPDPLPGVMRLTLPLTDAPADRLRSSTALTALVEFGRSGDLAWATRPLMLTTLSECLADWSAEIVRQLRAIPHPSFAWDPTATAMEVLTVGAVLAARRAGARDMDALSEVLGRLFDVGDASAWPEPIREQPDEWERLYQVVYDERETLASIARAWASGTKGGDRGPFLDPIRTSQVVESLLRTWRFAASPPAGVPATLAIYGSIVARLHRETVMMLREPASRDGRPGLADRERELALIWITRVREELLGTSPLQPQREQVEQATNLALSAVRVAREEAGSAQIGPDRSLQQAIDVALTRVEVTDMGRTFVSIQEVLNGPSEVSGWPALIGGNVGQIRADVSTFMQTSDAYLKETGQKARDELEQLQKRLGGGDGGTGLLEQIARDLQALALVTQQIEGNDAG